MNVLAPIYIHYILVFETDKRSEEMDREYPVSRHIITWFKNPVSDKSQVNVYDVSKSGWENFGDKYNPNTGQPMRYEKGLGQGISTCTYHNMISHILMFCRNKGVYPIIDQFLSMYSMWESRDSIHEFMSFIIYLGFEQAEEKKFILKADDVHPIIQEIRAFFKNRRNYFVADDLIKYWSYGFIECKTKDSLENVIKIDTFQGKEITIKIE